MHIVKISMSHPTWPIIRQTPGGLSRWGDTLFVINAEVKECDAWVVLDDLRNDVEQTICPPERTLFINLEPPTQKSYPVKFLSQFSTVVTCCGHYFEHPNIYETFPPVPWYLGISLERHHVPESNVTTVLNYDELKDLQPPKKNKLLSVICTSKAFTEGHLRRNEFIKRLVAHFGDEIDVFGDGSRFLHDKLEATANYEYHIVIENSCFPHYWTEKLSDAFLAWTYPIYYGCPNISEYFDPRSISVIDINSVEESIRTIEGILEQRPWYDRLPLIAEARKRVLDEYNLFPMVIKLLQPSNKPSEKRTVQIRSTARIIGRTRTTLRRIRRKLQFGLGVTKMFPFLRRI